MASAGAGVAVGADSDIAAGAAEELGSFGFAAAAGELDLLGDCSAGIFDADLDSMAATTALYSLACASSFLSPTPFFTLFTAPRKPMSIISC